MNGYEDFKVLAANFGGDGEKDKRWWSQGDFNNNQAVGLEDLKLLLIHGKWENWPEEQRNEVSKFLADHPGPYVFGPDPDTHQGTWTLLTFRNRQNAALSIPAREDSGGVPSSYVVLTEPRHGKVDATGYPYVKYTPVSEYTGIDDFVVAVKDDQGLQSNPVWVAVEVNAAMDPTLVAAYPCDENAGTALGDSCGNSKPGALKNTVTWTPGKVKSGLAFDYKAGEKFPVPGYVRLENSAAQDEVMSAGPYTLSLWVRPDGIPTAASTGATDIDPIAGLLTKTAGCGGGGLCFTADKDDRSKGRFLIRHMVWFGPRLDAISPMAYAPGEWHHVVGVVDPDAQDPEAGQATKASGVVRLYVDGRLAGKSHWSKEEKMNSLPFKTDWGGSKEKGDTYANSPFHLGTIQPGECPARDDPNHMRACFKGALDEVRIYKRALGDAEVAALFQGVVSMAPAISVTHPAPGATVAAGSEVALAASAHDADGGIDKVDYYLGSVAPANKLNATDLSGAPFSCKWKAAKPGTYSLIAVATDNSGVTAMSAPLTLTVK